MNFSPKVTVQRSVGRRSALHQMHMNNAAKLVNYSGYRLPLHFGSLLHEHVSVRESAGMFDNTHLCIFDVHGINATFWLRTMMSNDVAKLVDGKAIYTCLCRENGGVIDDMLVFRIGENHYRLYIDRARRKTDFAWLKSHIIRKVSISEVTGKSVIAVQGPDAVAKTTMALQKLGLAMPLADLPRYSSVTNGNWFVARTGFTGEDGVELTMPANQAVNLWQALASYDVVPVGLGARDTLRLEAGYGLYGQDIDAEHSPAESGIAHTIDTTDGERQFIGREILEDHQLFGGRSFQVGILLEAPGLLRRDAAVERVGQSVGKITSGGFSPTRGASIALARVNKKFDGICDAVVEGKLQPARITSVPFVPHGLARE